MVNYLEYKGYIGTVALSPQDRSFFGSIFGINDLVTFEAADFDSLEEELHKAVDDYLETCESLGRQPEKTYKGQLNVRIDPALHKELAYHAVRDNCSLNQYVENALRKAVEKKEDR